MVLWSVSLKFPWRLFFHLTNWSFGFLNRFYFYRDLPLFAKIFYCWEWKSIYHFLFLFWCFCLLNLFHFISYLFSSTFFFSYYEISQILKKNFHNLLLYFNELCLAGMNWCCIVCFIIQKNLNISNLKRI